MTMNPAGDRSRLARPAFDSWPKSIEEARPMSTVVVRGGISGFAQEVVVGRHRLTADEPEADGGTDTGPSPYDYLLGALGS